MRTSLAFLVLLACCRSTMADEPTEKAWFAPFQTVAEYRPKGPSHCFRQFNFDWSWVARREDQIPEFLSQADPAEFAVFCAKIKLDGTVVMAVPHHGYCTYNTKIGEKFPGMKGDWFGDVIEQLHRRKIAAFGYITLNWNWKYMRDNQGKDFVHGTPNPDGSFDDLDNAAICLNAPGYLDMVEGYTREVLEKYPVDGLRWDILTTAPGCTCAGCRAFYRELYGEEIPQWHGVEGRRQREFYIATTGRAVRRLAAVCRRIKPSVEIWQNQLNASERNDMNLSRLMDVAYNEFGDTFQLLLNKGVANKPAVINGLLNNVPCDPPLPLDPRAFRLCLILGGRNYSYYGHKHTDPRAGLPSPTMTKWHESNLAPYYRMVREIQPYFEGAVPVSPVGVVYCENTRFRYPEYDRQDYLQPIKRLTDYYLDRSLPLEFVNSLDLPDPAKRISRFQLLLVPNSSGLATNELEALRQYVRHGGNLLIAGDALRHDAKGNEQNDFALADEMGVHYSGVERRLKGWTLHAKEPQWSAIAEQTSLSLDTFVKVQPAEGSIMAIDQTGQPWPLLHESRLGRGTVAYLASLDYPTITHSVMGRLAGRLPTTVSPRSKHAILTYQEASKRWILHLLENGECTIRIPRATTCRPR